MSLFLQNPLSWIAALLGSTLLVTLLLPARNVATLRCVTLTSSILALLMGVTCCLAFDKSTAGFQFLTALNFIPEYNLSFTLGADGLSMVFLLLTLFIFPILFLSAWTVTLQPKQFWNYLLAMELLLVLTFSTLDILYFFVLFESLLIPMFILIGVWGARERKIKAAYYFFLYTLFGSLFMLFGIFYLYFLTGSTNYFVLLNSQLEKEQQNLIWLCFFLAFAVKMPLFPLHIWLPEAHVEAPTVGSMLLASLLLKLGGYGFLRFSLTFLSAGSVQYAPLVSTCALLGVIYGSLSTVRQIDLKRIIAYSSVAHMNLVMLGLFSYNQQGLEGAIYLMVGHGVVSAALFFCVGVLYDRHHSRLLRYYGGMVTVMPLFCGMFFAFTLANMSFPGTSNFLGELLVFLGIFSGNSTVLFFATAGIVLGAVYSTWLYNRVAFGTLKTKYIAEFTDVNRREFFILLALLVPMIALGLTASFVLDFVHLPVKAIVLSAEATTNPAVASPAAVALAASYFTPISATPMAPITPQTLLCPPEHLKNYAMQTKPAKKVTSRAELRDRIAHVDWRTKCKSKKMTRTQLRRAVRLNTRRPKQIRNFRALFTKSPLETDVATQKSLTQHAINYFFEKKQRLVAALATISQEQSNPPLPSTAAVSEMIASVPQGTSYTPWLVASGLVVGGILLFFLFPGGGAAVKAALTTKAATTTLVATSSTATAAALTAKTALATKSVLITKTALATKSVLITKTASAVKALLAAKATVALAASSSTAAAAVGATALTGVAVSAAAYASLPEALPALAVAASSVAATPLWWTPAMDGMLLSVAADESTTGSRGAPSNFMRTVRGELHVLPPHLVEAWGHVLTYGSEFLMLRDQINDLFFLIQIADTELEREFILKQAIRLKGVLSVMENKFSSFNYIREDWVDQLSVFEKANPGVELKAFKHFASAFDFKKIDLVSWRVALNELINGKR